MVNLGLLNLEEDEAGREGKNFGEYGSGSVKPPILGEGRSSVAFLRCIAKGSSNMRRNEDEGPLLELSGVRVKTEGKTKAGKRALGEGRA